MSQINPASSRSQEPMDTSAFRKKTFLRSQTQHDLVQNNFYTPSPSTSINTPCLSYHKHVEVLNSFNCDPTSGVICTPLQSHE